MDGLEEKQELAVRSLLHTYLEDRLYTFEEGGRGNQVLHHCLFYRNQPCNDFWQWKSPKKCHCSSSFFKKKMCWGSALKKNPWMFQSKCRFCFKHSCSANWLVFFYVDSHTPHDRMKKRVGVQTSPKQIEQQKSVSVFLAALPAPAAPALPLQSSHLLIVSSSPLTSSGLHSVLQILIDLN